ncbi:hypothetical protein X474_04760 [Dethiosulfatarculus sandiegensis]|uniref:Uncharacterized protein n=1 Tax=Dethiosulfatarculus sandiegensis TaxID=1429043 RepID=A0A0D2GKA0_9BACT|nr:hypothetical protein X474_04760 [Dethiosulfatarculus sandiegensis]
MAKGGTSCSSAIFLTEFFSIILLGYFFILRFSFIFFSFHHMARNLHK